MEGIFGLWKEAGMTSHDCVFKLRKILHLKRIGHAGTLDPGVAGVLPIAVGPATKLVEYLQDSGKTYEGKILLGKSTTTEDAEGEVVAATFLTAPPEASAVDDVLASFNGWVTQIPPMYSAVKVNGKRLYEYARQGLTVERPERQVWIEKFVRTSEIVYDETAGTAEFAFQVICGKGTYVRTLAVDCGVKLGVPSHMSHLVRTSSGGFQKADCFTLAEVAAAVAQDPTGHFMQPLGYGVKDFPRLDLTPELFQRTNNGQVLTASELGLSTTPPLIALFYQDELVSVYQVHPAKPNCYKPQKVFRKEG